MRVTNTSLPNCIPGKLAILFSHSEKIQHKSTTQFSWIISYSTKNAYNQRGVIHVAYTTASSLNQMLTTKLPTMHFAIIGTLDYYRSIFVTLILKLGVRDPVFKNKKKYTFLQLKLITKTTLKIQLSLNSLSTSKVTLCSNIIRFLMKRQTDQYSVSFIYDWTELLI